jgi:hypothetical protein
VRLTPTNEENSMAFTATVLTVSYLNKWPIISNMDGCGYLPSLPHWLRQFPTTGTDRLMTNFRHNSEGSAKTQPWCWPREKPKRKTMKRRVYNYRTWNLFGHKEGKCEQKRQKEGWGTQTRVIQKISSWVSVAFPEASNNLGENS